MHPSNLNKKQLKGLKVKVIQENNLVFQEPI